MNAVDTNIMSQLRIFDKGHLGIPMVVLAMLAMMILPLPAIILDFLFTFNIVLSILVLLATVYTLRPLDFAVFPTVLLLATLLRLALNIASTRVVLLNGHLGNDAAGQVIKAFGEVVIGGNFTVGLVVFAILIIINFVVVTKGAGRISEVTARFTLDAMPGKQMAIDADLNAGIIDQAQARIRREEVGEEADFYGAMDGASKFVRGDAIAGIMILFINIIGGVAIGMLQQDMTFRDAAHVFVLLTIGDGLVAQIPALLLSVAAAILVTRVSKSEDMGAQLSRQMFATSKPLLVSGGILMGLGIIPGMPHLAFLGLGGLTVAFGLNIDQKTKQLLKANQMAALQAPVQDKKLANEQEISRDLSWEDVPVVDTLGLEIGYRLIPLVDKEQSGELMSRIKGVRKKLSQELGYLIPTVHIRDNLDLNPNAYRISILGVTTGEAHIYPDKDMAINPGQVFGELKGLETTDPAFGLKAYWIDKNQREQAQTLGFTVVDATTVLATHLSQIIKDSSAQLLGHDEVQQLLGNLAKSAPKLTEDLVPKLLPLGTVVKVLQNLLEEHVPIRDMRTIAETLTAWGSRSQDPSVLTMAVRAALGRMIVQQINGTQAELPVITLSPNLEQILQRSNQHGNEDNMVIEPGLADRLQQSLKACVEKQEQAGQAAVLLVTPQLRGMLSRFVKNIIPGLHVLSYQEVPADKHIKIIGSIGDTA